MMEQQITYKNYIFSKDEFEVQIENNNIIVKPKIKIVKILTTNDFIDNYNAKDFRYSKILSCFINNENKLIYKYLTILKNLYGLIGSGKKIIKNTLLNYETIEIKENGFIFLNNLGISIQPKEAGDILVEIINQSLVNKIKIEIVIELQKNEKIKIINF